MRPSLYPTPSAPVRTEIQSGLWLDSRLAVRVATQRLLLVADFHFEWAIAPNRSFALPRTPALPVAIPV